MLWTQTICDKENKIPIRNGFRLGIFFIWIARKEKHEPVCMSGGVLIRVIDKNTLEWL